MKRKILLIPLLLLLKTMYSQVGIGTANPRGALDINKPTTNDFGLVLPTNTGIEKISNPMGGNAAIGTVIFDSTEDCIKVYKSTGWSNCISDTSDTSDTSDNISTLDCTQDTATGTYSQGVASNGTKIISYTGGNGKAYEAISISSTGVTGLTAKTSAGTLANGNGNITLNISGTPSTAGMASFTVNIGGKSCTFTVNVDSNSPIVSALSCDGALTGNYTQGVTSNGTKIISYTGGNGKAYEAISISSTGVTGLTAKTSAGTLANGNGNITLNISGTPSTTGTASFTVNIGGKSCTFTVNVSTRNIRILSFEPDAWSSPLSSGNNTAIARSKLNKSSNFGPQGKVKIKGFVYTSINVKQASPEMLKSAIDNADIIWVGYIRNNNFPDYNKKVLSDKIAEGKKFFFISADGDTGNTFFPFPNFHGYEFVKTPKNQNIIRITNENVTPTNGLFGKLPVNYVIFENLFKSGITRFPEGSTSFMITQDGRVNGTINNNLVVVGDLNWYISKAAEDGFRNGTDSCTENNNSILFCNILQTAIEYIQSH